MENHIWCLHCACMSWTNALKWLVSNAKKVCNKYCKMRVGILYWSSCIPIMCVSTMHDVGWKIICHKIVRVCILSAWFGHWFWLFQSLVFTYFYLLYAFFRQRPNITISMFGKPSTSKNLVWQYRTWIDNRFPPGKDETWSVMLHIHVYIWYV